MKNQNEESMLEIPNHRYSYSVYSQRAVQDSDIDLFELWNEIWRRKWIIVAITSVFAVASIFYALSLPNVYESRSLLAPSGETRGGGVSRMAGQLGGLASLAGISLGADDSRKVRTAVEVTKSRKFISDFIDRHSILPELMAVKKWEPNENKLVFDPDLYDVDTGNWVREVTPPQTAKPSAWEAYKAFSAIMNISQDNETGFITLTVRHQSPYVAKHLATLLVKDVNTIMKKDDVKEAQHSIEFLQKQLTKVSVADMRNVFYQLIEEQTKTVMLAEVREEYVFKTIDPPVVAEEKAEPRRAIICLVGTIIGGILAIIFIFFYKYVHEHRQPS